jgi:hypothetical protein
MALCFKEFFIFTLEIGGGDTQLIKSGWFFRRKGMGS